jgi:hypothetical protein
MLLVGKWLAEQWIGSAVSGTRSGFESRLHCYEVRNVECDDGDDDDNNNNNNNIEQDRPI